MCMAPPFNLNPLTKMRIMIKKGVFCNLIFELQKTLATHYIYTM
jgi:hypothetical protein